MLSLAAFLVTALPVQSLALGRAIEDRATKCTLLSAWFATDVASVLDLNGRHRFAKTVRVGSLVGDLLGRRDARMRLCLGIIGHLVAFGVVQRFRNRIKW